MLRKSESESSSMYTSGKSFILLGGVTDRGIEKCLVPWTVAGVSAAPHSEISGGWHMHDVCLAYPEGPGEWDYMNIPRPLVWSLKVELQG